LHRPRARPGFHVAEEALGGIRTVRTFTAVKSKILRYGDAVMRSSGQGRLIVAGDDATGARDVLCEERMTGEKRT
jgi:hypothetical protein